MTFYFSILFLILCFISATRNLHVFRIQFQMCLDFKATEKLNDDFCRSKYDHLQMCVCLLKFTSSKDVQIIVITLNKKMQIPLALPYSIPDLDKNKLLLFDDFQNTIYFLCNVVYPLILLFCYYCCCF